MTSASELPLTSPKNPLITVYWNTGENYYSARVNLSYLREALSRWLEPQGGVKQALMVWIGLCDDQPAATRRGLDGMLRPNGRDFNSPGEELTVGQLAELLGL